MKRLIILSALATAPSLWPSQAGAAINGTDANAYLQRGKAMYADKNFDGCIDQLLQIRLLDPTPSQREEVSYFFAMATLYTGDDEAVDLLKAFLAGYPQSPRCEDVTATIGDYYFTRGSYGDALAYYKRVNPNGLTPDRAEDLTYRMAYSHMLLGETNRATELFNTLLKDKRYANAALFYKGYIAYFNHDYSAARELLSGVDPSREPGQAATYYLCQLDFRDGLFRQAGEQAVNLLRKGAPEEFKPELQRIAGESLYNQGRVEDALPYLREYISSAEHPMPTAFYILGVDDYESGNYSGAMALLQNAVSSNDVTGQSAYLYLGKCYVKTGDINSATMAFEKASKMAFSPAITETATYDYIAARLDGGRSPFSSSVSMMENFLKQYPQSPYASKIRESLVTGYMSDSDFENALRIINSSGRKLSPTMASAKQNVLLRLGSRAYEQGQTAQALSYFTDGRNVQGGDAELRRQCTLWAGNCRYDSGDYSAAVADYKAFLASAPATDVNRILATYNLGYSLLQLERYDEALTCFNQVAADTSLPASTRADALNRAGDCLYCSRDFAKAAELYRKAYDTYPQAGDYSLYQQAEMAAYNRDYRQRINLLDRMLTNFPGSPLVPGALMAKAESYNVLGEPARANEIYTSIASKYPSAPQSRQALVQLAMNRLNSGDRQGAIEAYREVAVRYPSSSEARVALDDLKNIYASDGRLPEYVELVNAIGGGQRIDMSELESTAFAAASEQYLDKQSTALLRDYIKQYPSGANMPAALLYLAEDAEERNDNTAAYDYASQIVALYPDSDQAEAALFIKADSEASQGKLEMALDSYKALTLRTSTPEALSEARMGVLTTAIDLGRYGDALDTSEQLLASSAGNAPADQVKFLRALAFDRTGRSDEAYEIWSELAAQPSTLSGSKSAVYMIESLTAKGQLKRAEELANKFIDAGSPHNYWYARGFIAYSDVLRAQDKKFEADEYLKALRENYPGQEADIFTMIDERLQ